MCAGRVRVWSGPAFTTGGSSGSVRTTVTSEVDVSLPVRRRT